MIDCKEELYLHTGVIRGHHVYNSVWMPEEVLLSIEVGNDHDCCAVCVKKGKQMAGHVPRKFFHKVWHF